MCPTGSGSLPCPPLLLVVRGSIHGDAASRLGVAHSSATQLSQEASSLFPLLLLVPAADRSGMDYDYASLAAAMDSDSDDDSEAGGAASGSGSDVEEGDSGEESGEEVGGSGSGEEPEGATFSDMSDGESGSDEEEEEDEEAAGGAFASSEEDEEGGGSGSDGELSLISEEGASGSGSEEFGSQGVEDSESEDAFEAELASGGGLLLPAARPPARLLPLPGLPPACPCSPCSCCYLCRRHAPEHVLFAGYANLPQLVLTALLLLLLPLFPVPVQARRGPAAARTTMTRMWMMQLPMLRWQPCCASMASSR